jgi:transglutaminase-like putative cysteine protease
MSNVVPIRVAMGGELEVGNRIRLPVFDPTSLSTRTVEVRVLEYDTLFVTDSASLDPRTGRWSPARTDSIPAWKIAEVFGGIQVLSWVDEDGRILRASSPLGFAMEKTEYELARQAQEDARLTSGSPIDDDVILSTAVQSNVDLENVEQFGELRFHLTGVDLAGFQLDGGRQTLRGDTLIVRREQWNQIDPGYRLPYSFMDLRDALQPEPLIQSDDPRIIDQARRMTASRSEWRQDPKRVAEQLTRSVYNMLEKSITFSVPNAVQVLATLQGDCNEHTVLYVALARAGPAGAHGCRLGLRERRVLLPRLARGVARRMGCRRPDLRSVPRGCLSHPLRHRRSRATGRDRAFDREPRYRRDRPARGSVAAVIHPSQLNSCQERA